MSAQGDVELKSQLVNRLIAFFVEVVLEAQRRKFAGHKGQQGAEALLAIGFYFGQAKDVVTSLYPPASGHLNLGKGIQAADCFGVDAVVDTGLQIFGLKDKGAVAILPFASEIAPKDLGEFGVFIFAQCVRSPQFEGGVGRDVPQIFPVAQIG